MSAKVELIFSGEAQDVKEAMCLFLQTGQVPKDAAAVGEIDPPQCEEKTITAPLDPPPSTGAATGVDHQAGLELDAEGLPWDARINTSNKTQTAKGVWKRKPGIDDSVIDQVKMELRANITSPVTEEPPHLTDTPGQAAGADATPPTSASGMTWAEFMHATHNAQLDPAAVLSACVAHGVADVTALQDNPHLIPAIAMHLGINVPQ